MYCSSFSLVILVFLHFFFSFSHILVWSVHLHVCLSHLCNVHHAKAVGWNEVPFSRDTCVVSRCIIHAAPDLHGEGRFGGQNPQFAVMPPVAKLL